MAYVKLNLTVEAISEPCDEDQHVAGTYEVLVDQRLPRRLWANAVLDHFHEHVAVDQLDSFEFSVLHEGAKLTQDEAEEDYTLGHHVAELNYLGPDISLKNESESSPSL